VDLKNLLTHGIYIVSAHFDKSTYNSVLAFLDIKRVSPEWYGKCIEGSNRIKEVNEDLYWVLLWNQNLVLNSPLLASKFLVILWSCPMLESIRGYLAIENALPKDFQD
jgi:hypothetical protein